MKRLALLPLAGLLALGAASSRTFAQAPPPSSAPAPSIQLPDRPELERRREQLMKELRERGLAIGSASGQPFGQAAPFTSGAVPPASAAPNPAAELARRWRAFSESRLERRERRRVALVRELGHRLADPRVKDELRLHATRVAELTRIKFLAENARSGAQRQLLLTRVAKLQGKEEARHRAKLAELARTAPRASDASARPAAPAPSGSGAVR